jgi:hypothetical protein
MPLGLAKGMESPITGAKEDALWSCHRVFSLLAPSLVQKSSVILKKLIIL